MKTAIKEKVKKTKGILWKKIPAPLIIGTIVFAIILIWIIDRKGISNTHVCNCLKPGINKEELIRKLGNPVQIIDQTTTQFLLFESSMFAAGPIEAKINKKSGKVLKLKCDEDSPPLWNFEEEPTKQRGLNW
jgi:hypothetical protein